MRSQSNTKNRRGLRDDEQYVANTAPPEIHKLNLSQMVKNMPSRELDFEDTVSEPSSSSDVNSASESNKKKEDKEKKQSKKPESAQSGSKFTHSRFSSNVEDLDVERALCELVEREMPETLLDIGTGTGRILEILAPFLMSGEGVDLSTEMLSVARTNLDKPGLEHCRVRQGNMYHLPYEDTAFDFVTLHQVLHYAGQPADVVAEISRVLRPSGTAVIIDFAPHNYEDFREEFQHRRLGFSDAEIQGLLRQFRLKPSPPVKFPGRELTVSLWTGRKA